ncbi:MAG: Dam family site-specific DNA-(adenine-N6)-methyltransferase, partial [Nanoarchaeota archaeon]|nr:Dam family site-specific DNA-(adenine-N6)-methyltransferase [Nanoarchaeota archaeon]
KNEELINCFEVVHNNVELLIESLKNHKKLNSKEYFYEIRNRQPKDLDKIERASRFIYLNKTCFNGLYRVNSDNRFNVPFGNYKNPSILNEKLLYESNKFLKGVIIKPMIFEKVLDLCKKGDFIYFDPPYFPISKTSSFTSYTNGTFLENEQINLAELFKKLDTKGCLLMLSNSDHPFIRELYKGYDIQTVKARRVISCIGSKREIVNEIVVRNYNHTNIKNFIKN